MRLHSQTVKVTFSSLLHDIGKAAYRSGESGSHSESGYHNLKKIINDSDILDGVRYHHASELKRASVSSDSLAYIVCIADNIAAATDRRKKENSDDSQKFRRDLPLTSIFSHMNGNMRSYELPLSPLNDTCVMPKPSGTYRLTSSEYQTLLRELLRGLKTISMDAAWMNSALSLLEAYTSSMPSSTNTEESPDISLFDHVKITAAVGACISEYLLEQNETDYKTRLFTHENDFKKEQAFLLYSADFSGIQNFIYTIASSKALKALRSRSFFLELVMEHYIDEILDGCGLSRANLLYSGGGHCYLLLPNTEQTIETLRAAKQMLNTWLRKNFGTRLYLADGFTACTSNELTNQPAKQAPYKEMFSRVSHIIATNKMHRYSADDLRQLNSGEIPSDGRECKICGITSHLSGSGDDCKCSWCSLFESLSTRIQDPHRNIYVVSRNPSVRADITLPSLNGSVFITLTDEVSARKFLAASPDVVRIYAKNKLYTGLAYSTKLYIGDYYASNLMDELAEQASGIARNAVCRMDVDDLGAAFVSGFKQKDSFPDKRYQYVTLSRTAAFSRQMSLFFKYYINSILRGLAVTIIYSGGDDVFLIGAWNDILAAAQKIQHSFSEFTCGTLTLSAGILVHEAKYPIRRAAAQSQELEAFSKQNPGKNSVTVFDLDESLRYTWADFSDKVMGEKYKLISTFFNTQKKIDGGRGKAFLYRLLDLLRHSSEQINLARFAYLLARMEPTKDKTAKQLYQVFSKNMYQWYLQPEDRKQLVTAIYIYVYLTRTER